MALPGFTIYTKKTKIERGHRNIYKIQFLDVVAIDDQRSIFAIIAV